MCKRFSDVEIKLGEVPHAMLYMGHMLWHCGMMQHSGMTQYRLLMPGSNDYSRTLL